MARRATKDTFGIERVGDVEIRRRVVAGQIVPDQLEVDEGDLEDVQGTALPSYKDGAATQRVTVENEVSKDNRKVEQAARKSEAADHPAADEHVEEKAAQEARAALEEQASDSKVVGEGSTSTHHRRRSPAKDTSGEK